jgi:hypothetical protein
VFGWGEDNDQTWPKRLENRLASTDRPLKVYNLGKPDADPDDYLDIARSYVPFLKPKILLVSLLQGDDLAQLLLKDGESTAPRAKRPIAETDLAIMRRLDRLHLEFPFAGARMLRGLLAAEGSKIGRRHLTTLMQRMGIEALYRRPRTTKPEPGRKIYPYLLRGIEVTRPNQVWAMDITYVPMARGFVYLAVVLDWLSRRVLSWRLSITMEAAFCVETLEDALARHAVRQPTRPTIRDQIRD